ncbi:MAG: hypothetical protein JWO05_1200 [Gemmatimonadetes bacterium]|nr:hypothetical protein [Gemmatimonadota bacterium]
MLEGCSPDASTRRDGTTSSQRSSLSPSGSRANPTDALVAYLEDSREGAPKSTVSFDSLVTCQIGDGVYQPIDMLATYHILDQAGRGDTITVRVRITTVAEEDESPVNADRYLARQRVRTDTLRWLIARTHAGEWRVCEGPQFGFYGTDSTTSWQPAGASHITARQLADSIYRSDPP